jgi:hypothetical protein
MVFVMYRITVIGLCYFQVLQRMVQLDGPNDSSSDDDDDDDDDGDKDDDDDQNDEENDEQGEEEVSKWGIGDWGVNM